MVYHPTLAVVQPMQGNLNVGQSRLPWQGWPKDATPPLHCQEAGRQNVPLYLFTLAKRVIFVQRLCKHFVEQPCRARHTFFSACKHTLDCRLTWQGRRLL